MAAFETYSAFYSGQVVPALERQAQMLGELIQLEQGFSPADAEDSFQLHRMRAGVAGAEKQLLDALGDLERQRAWAEHEGFLLQPLAQHDIQLQVSDPLSHAEPPHAKGRTLCAIAAMLVCAASTLKLDGLQPLQSPLRQMPSTAARMLT